MTNQPSVTTSLGRGRAPSFHGQGGWRVAALVALGLAAGTAACGADPGSELPFVAACAPENVIGGQCAGVPAAPLCEEATCAPVECASVVVVGSDAEIAAALLGAAAGTCIAAKPGSYGDVVLPAGVHLVGRSANEVSFGTITAQGSSPIVRGVSAKNGIVVAAGTTSARIEAVRAKGGAAAAIVVEEGASAEIVRSEAHGSSGYGISAFGAAGLSIDLSIVEANLGPGVWAQCGDPCACTVPLVVSLGTSIVRDNKYVGVALAGVTGTITTVDIRDNTVASDFEPGGGLSIAHCSDVTAKGLRVLDNTYFGILVDSSSATIGGPAPEDAVEVSRNLRGIWIQGDGDPMNVKLEQCGLMENAGVAVGLDGSAVGVIIFGTEIQNTQAVDLPVKVGGVSAGVEKVGDGLTWLGGAKAQIDGLTIGASARQPFLIDAEVAEGSSISNVVLEAGDDAKGILIQNLPSGGEVPAVSSSPAPTIVETEQLSVPDALGVPTP